MGFPLGKVDDEQHEGDEGRNDTKVLQPIDVFFAPVSP